MILIVIIINGAPANNVTSSSRIDLLSLIHLYPIRVITAINRIVVSTSSLFAFCIFWNRIQNKK
jgi:hypothetical protein